MSRKWLSLAMVVLAVTALAIAANTPVTRAARESASIVISEETDQIHRKADGKSPTLSSIDSPGPTCYRSSVGVCYLQWNYLSVSASPSQYIISMTVSINGRVRAYHAGSFQTSMYIPGDMFKPGFKVACGWRGANGAPELGYSYLYVIRAAETGGLESANYGTVTCPASAGAAFLPFVIRP